MIFWELFVSYLKIGFFGFGGGYAMLSLIQNEVVVQHAWMTNAEFADIVAVSQITPGPIAINSATYVGYTVGMQSGSIWYGILGSVIALVTPVVNIGVGVLVFNETLTLLSGLGMFLVLAACTLIAIQK